MAPLTGRAVFLLVILLSGCERGPWPDFDTLWNFDDPAATEERFHEILDRRPPDLDYRLQLTTQLVRAVGLQGRFDEGLALLGSVSGDLPEANDVTRVRWLLEQGRLYNSAGSPVLARRPLEEAFGLASPPEDARATRDPALDRYAVDAAHMLAILHEGRDRIAWNRRAIALADASDDPGARAWLGSLYNNLGFAEMDAGRYKAALKTHRKAHAWYSAEGDARWARVSRWAEGKTLRLLDRCDDALEIQQALEAAWDADGAPDGYVFEEIAECRLLQGEEEVARLYFARALELLRTDAWLVEHESDRLERIEALSRTPDTATDE